MEKLLYYDLETTGTRFWKNGIHQISGAIVKDVFILIIKEDFPEYFKNYLYQIKFRNN